LADTVRKEVKHHRPGTLKKPNIHFVRASQVSPEGQLLRTMCRMFSLDAGEGEICNFMFIADNVEWAVDTMNLPESS